MAVALAGTALAATPARGVGVTRVPCDSPQLPSAVAAANAAGSGTLLLSPHCTYRISSTLHVIGTASITIIGGPNTTIRSDPAAGAFGPILDVPAGGTLRVKGIFIIGGAFTNGAGITNAGFLVVRNTTISGNSATASGGGVFNATTGNAVIDATIIGANTAAFGGGIYNLGRLTLFRSLVIGNNSTTLGGGILTDDGAVTRIIQSTISKNTSPEGGGIWNRTTGRTSLSFSLVQLNKADNAVATSGGGIFNLNPTVGGVILISSIVRKNAPNNCTSPTPIQGCLN